MAAIGCLVAAVALTAGLAADAAADRRAWGETTAVVVVRRPVPAGAVVGPDDIATRDLPRALVPAGSVPAPEAPTVAIGRVAATDLAAGEVLLATRLAPEAFSSGRGVGPRGRTLAVPLDLPAPPVEAGDRVDLLAPAAGTEPALGAAPPAVVVAEEAVVVGVDDATLVVAVAGPDVPEVVAALLQHTVVAVARPR